MYCFLVVEAQLTYLFPMHPFSAPWKKGWRKGAFGTNGFSPVNMAWSYLNSYPQVLKKSVISHSLLSSLSCRDTFLALVLKTFAKTDINFFRYFLVFSDYLIFMKMLCTWLQSKLSQLVIKFFFNLKCH